ncbi:hypothetical protein GP486_007892, partial [Trichoglossum hirsutum]
MPQVIDLTGDSPPGQDRREGIQQPGQPNAATRLPANELGLNPSLGGGAEVRICNPCVPDPNNEPPPQRGHQQSPASSRLFPTFAPQGYNTSVGDGVFNPNGVGDLNPRDPWSGARLDRATFADRTRSRPGYRPYDLTYPTAGTYPTYDDPNSLPSFQSLSFDNEEDLASAVRDRIIARERNADNLWMTGGPGNSPLARNSSNPASSRASRPMSLEGSLPFPGFAPADGRGLAVSHLPRGISYAGSSRYDPSTSNPSMILPRGTPPTYTPQGPSSSAPTRGPHRGPPRHHRPMQSTGSAYMPRVRSMLDIDNTEPATPHPPHPHPPPPPGPTLREEDYCPICQAILPPPRPDGSEEAREAHIENCIQMSFYGTTLPTTSPHQQSPATGNPPSSSQAPGPTSTPPSGGIARSRRGTVGRMVTFSATEKDCVGEGGEGVAECVICFEDIEVGVEMARLECLCKFHK